MNGTVSFSSRTARLRSWSGWRGRIGSAVVVVVVVVVGVGGGSAGGGIGKGLIIDPLLNYRTDYQLRYDRGT